MIRTSLAPRAAAFVSGPALLLALLLAALPAHAVSPDRAGSPLTALQAEREAVLTATRLDELLDYIPEEQKDYVSEMPDDEKAAALAGWKERLETIRFEEFIVGDRAAVLIESDAPDGLSVRIMQLDGDRWVTLEEIELFSGLGGARGSYVAEGSVETTLELGLIQQNRINGIPVLTIRNELARLLDEETAVFSVMLVLDECLAVGEVDLAPRKTEYMTLGSRFEAPGENGDPLVFRHEPSGTLRIESVADDRFSGSFELTARGESPTGIFASREEQEAQRGQVIVRGRIENARNPCEEAESR